MTEKKVKRPHRFSYKMDALEAAIEMYGIDTVANMLGRGTGTVYEWRNSRKLPLGADNHLRMILKEKDRASEVRELKKQVRDMQQQLDEQPVSSETHNQQEFVLEILDLSEIDADRREFVREAIGQLGGNIHRVQL